MSEHLTREQLVAQAAEAIYEASRPPFEPTGPDWVDLPDQWRWCMLVHPALPVIAKAVTDRVRALHEPIEIEPSDTICGPCSFLLPNGRYFGKVEEYPCPTVLLCDEIDTEIGVQR